LDHFLFEVGSELKSVALADDAADKKLRGVHAGMQEELGIWAE
jgi:hypothetical protein